MATTTPTPALVSRSGEPVSLQEAADQIQGGVPADQEAALRRKVAAAREWFEKATDRTLGVCVWRLTLPGFAARVELPNPPLVEVTSVTYLLDGVATTLDPATYTVVTSRTPGAVELADGQSWPDHDTHPEAVAITYTGGYGEAGLVPDLLKEGILLLAAHWYDHRGDAADVPPAVRAIAWASAAHRF